jgi:hypothetical protein
MGSDLAPFTVAKWLEPSARIRVFVRIRIGDETILGPISVRIWIGHSTATAYIRVLLLPKYMYVLLGRSEEVRVKEPLPHFVSSLRY